MPGIEDTMREYRKGTLHSGSKHGPKVTSKKQAIAIGLAQQQRGKKKPKRRGGISEAIEQHMKGRGARKQNGYGHSLDPHPEDPDDGY